jgi:hypothetical protein
MREAEEAALARRQMQLVAYSAVAAAADAPTAAFDASGEGDAPGVGSLLQGIGAGDAWDEVHIPEGMGLEVSSRLKWRQTQTHGEPVG